jgi:hypothetical protein
MSKETRIVLLLKTRPKSIDAGETVKSVVGAERIEGIRVVDFESPEGLSLNDRP